MVAPLRPATLAKCLPALIWAALGILAPMSCAALVPALARILVPETVPSTVLVLLLGLGLHARSRRRRALGRNWRLACPRRPPDRPGAIYLGQAFVWDLAQAQTFADLASEPMDPLIGRHGTGDTRIFGVGALRARPWHLPTAAFQRMVMAIGSTGCGKSRLAQRVIHAAIHHPDRPPIIVIDPKGDRMSRALIVSACQQVGRTCLRLSVADPDHSPGYNPLLRYERPEDLGQRLAAIIPPSQQPAFHDTPVQWATTVCLALHWLRVLLLAQGGQGSQAPPVQVALDRWRRGRGEGAAVEEGSIAAASPVEVPTLMAPDAWAMDIMVLADWALVRPQVLMAWILRLAKGFDGERTPDDPEAAPSDKGSAMVAAWSQARPQGDCGSIWAQYQDGFSAHHGIAVAALGPVMGALAAIAQLPAKERANLASALPTAIGALGRMAGVLRSQDPGIRLDAIAGGSSVLLIELASMHLTPTARVLGKLILGDLVALLGERYARDQVDRPLWLVVDELAEVVCEPLIQCINKGRGAGLHVLLLTQCRSDLVAALGSSSQADQVLENLGAVIQFQTNSPRDAEAIAMRSGEVQIDALSRGVHIPDPPSPSPVTASPRQMTFASQGRTLLPAWAVMRLPVGQAAIYHQGRVRMVQLAEMPMPDVTDPGPDTPTAHAEH